MLLKRFPGMRQRNQALKVLVAQKRPFGVPAAITHDPVIGVGERRLNRDVLHNTLADMKRDGCRQGVRKLPKPGDIRSARALTA